MAKISIITVCLNVVDTIERTLKSIANQTFQGFEWIVVDGSSEDGTVKVIENYKERIDIFISEPDRGVYHAMNKGISNSKSEYVMFINGGDCLESINTLEKIVKSLNGCDILYGNVISVDSHGDPFMLKMPRKITKNFHFRKTLPHQSTVVKRDLFSKIGLYDEQYEIAADYDFTMRSIFIHQCTAAHLDEVFSIFFGGGISSDFEKREEEKRRIRKKIFCFLEYYFLLSMLWIKKKIKYQDYVTLPVHNYDLNKW